MSNNIKKVLRSKGTRANHICQEIDLNPSILSLYINGSRKPNQKRLKQLAKALKCTVKDLYPNGRTRRITYYEI